MPFPAAFVTPVPVGRYPVTPTLTSSRNVVRPARLPRSAPAPARMTAVENLWKVNELPSIPARATEGKSVAIVGAGLAGLITAMELTDAGLSVQLYDTRPFAGGKVGSWVDADGNHIEMGLHVFFGCYYNLFDVMAKLGTFRHLLLKQHVHQFISEGGSVAALDFRLLGVGAPINGLKAFLTTSQLGLSDKLSNAYALGRSVIVRGIFDFDGAMRDIRSLDDISFSDWFEGKGGSRGSIERLWNPIAYALGFIDCDNMSARCMLTIFQLFAAKSEASVLRMLEGSPNDYLVQPIVDYIESKGGSVNLRSKIRSMEYADAADGRPRISGLRMSGSGSGPGPLVEADYYVAACDVQGMKRLVPTEWRERFPEFDRLFSLSAVPVVTVQIRYDGWVTEMDPSGLPVSTDGKGRGLDNLLYSSDADFSCFADLAITSPTHYYKEGLGSLMQCVLTPGDPYITKPDEFIVDTVRQQLEKLFPSARNLKTVWSSVVKLAESLYREEPGMDAYRPSQKSPIPNLFLAGSYTYQDYIDSMEGAVKSGRLAATALLETVKADAAAAVATDAS